MFRSKHHKKQKKGAFYLSGLEGERDLQYMPDISEEDRNMLQTYYHGFKNHLSFKANPVFARFEFHSPSGLGDKFITALCRLNVDEITRDQLA